VEQRGAYYLIMPITIERKKFSYVSEFAQAFDVSEPTVLNWIYDFADFPAIQVGSDNGRGIWLIEHVEGKRWMREVKGRVPNGKF